MSRDRSVAVGIEVGGNKATVALIDAHGLVRHRCYAKTLRGRLVAPTLDPYIRAVDMILAHAHAERWPVRGIGVSIPGMLDQSERRPLQIPILPALNGFPLCDLLENRYQSPVRLLVDVDAAILGEQRFGAGRGFHNLLYLTVNAVVGAALVVDGQLEQSALRYTGHICHLPVATSGPRCSCGKLGCINTLISIDAMQKMVQRAWRRGEETQLMQRLLNREYFSHSLLAEEALRGDSVALQVYSEVGRWLSAAVMRFIDLFDPNVLILGGDVLCTGDLLLTQIHQLLAASTIPSHRQIAVLPANLGSDAALIGAVVSFLPASFGKRRPRRPDVADTPVPPAVGLPERQIIYWKPEPVRDILA